MRRRSPSAQTRAVLASLVGERDRWRHGYDISKETGLASGTLYPLLRRLEEQGLLESEWNTEGSRPRRYYRRSAAGSQLFDRLIVDWREIIDVMNGLLAGKPKENI